MEMNHAAFAAMLDALKQAYAELGASPTWRVSKLRIETIRNAIMQADPTWTPPDWKPRDVR